MVFHKFENYNNNTYFTNYKYFTSYHNNKYPTNCKLFSNKKILHIIVN